ncbi:IgGFc-binding protein-like [Trichomycterus rosablanca]|uniref:IgGFc-binding protein-like n=1 Tax=Trichomycterus rosablanca TaxID=2290929 RepID=UPI002F35EE8F
MGTLTFILCVGILTVNAASGCPLGREFITAFLPNYITGDGQARPTLYITAQESVTTVTVEVKGLGFKQSLRIEAGTTKLIVLPDKAEIGEDGVSSKTVLILSDADVAVVTSNIKPFTGDSSVIFPTQQLGKSYVVFTPDGGPMNEVVAIVNGKDANTIDILPYSNLMLKNMKHLQQGVKTTVTLAPYQVYLLRSDKTLSGIRINSQLPLAVLSGHECWSLYDTCEHVYEQLVPIEALSDEYLVPAMHPLIPGDTAHVVAAEQDTDVTVYHGPIPLTKKLQAGELLNVMVTLPTVIRSNKKIMVMYTSTNNPFDEFFTNIIPVSKMSKSWSIYALDDYQNFAVIVSEGDTSKNLFGLLNLNVFPGNKKYTWAIKPLGTKEGTISLTSELPQAVYVFGGKIRHGYSTTGVCNAPTLPPVPVDPCANVKCREREQCKNGVCVRIETAICWAVGDPHYKTFDGKYFDLQGTCTYTVSTTVKTEKNLVPFTILAKNNNRGSNYVSYVRTVSVNVYNYTVVASKQAGMVQVDGENTNLPVTLAGGKLKVVQSGWNALVTTDFGLEVKYDWNMMLYITVPITYSGSLGGLCGNYNGDWTDDQTDIKGTKLSTVLEFAKSWKVADNDSFCQDDCVGKCLLCSVELKEKYSDESYCGLIAKTNGPFASCHKVVLPGAFFDNCVYDVCINRGVRSFLCENMRSYADACMSAGVKIDANWRMLADCPLPCPENSHYEACGTACAASCSDKDAPSKCNMPCVEGCQCNTGFVLSGTKCVPVNQCGCTYEGRYYLPAKTFWGDKTCTQKCTCNSQTGQVTCVATKCKSSEVCDLRNGLRQCYPRSYGHCHGSGDPHYLTFDGRAFDFQGTCTYYLSKVVDKSDSSLVPFEVLVKNENRGRNTAVAFTKTVEINVFNYTIIMTKDYYGKVMVNNLFINLPFEKDSRLSVFLSGYFGVVKTTFGMNVRYNWDSYVSITLPSTYSNVMGGLCGNWNGDLNDDLAFPNKSITTNPSVFADSWKARNDNGCTGGCQGNTCPKCDAAERNKEAYTKPCSMITDKNGPFKACHAASCKANSHYDVCAAGCPQTCSGLTEPAACQRAPCIEGCVCDAGFVLSNGACVSIEQCGCLYEGQYYHLNQVLYPKGKCEFKCTCNDRGQVTCKEGSSCGPNERCEVRDGVQACYPEGQGSCSVSGSGTYRSYDGNSISVAGDCIYKLVEMGQTGDMKKIPFSVMVKQISSAIDVMVTRRVDIVVAQYKITLVPGLLWKIKLNEVTTNLPTTLEGGLVKVYQSGLFIVLETTFGLKVTYDTVSTATVEIPSTYKSSVRGLCGNYNDNKADDLLMPDGTQASSVEKFLDAWKVAQEGVNCKTGCLPGSTCTNPDPGAQKEADNSCKILIVENGPFSNCYSKIPPKPFYDDCAKDVPLQPKDKTLVCRHIQKYVALCQQAGISISSWRNNTFCALNCPAQSHYEICADTCSSSCASLSMAQTCPVCLEGCQCDEGFLFDGGDCKPVDSCGCLVDGKYYKSGETVVQGDCTETCSCKAGQFSCQPNKCTENEICSVKDGVRACVREMAICWAVGDPHYKTFDGKYFDLQGTCTYTVSTTIKTEKNLVPFTILVKNNNRGSNYVSYVRTVSVKVYNYTVVASKQVGVVEVDGENTNLPVTLAGGKLKVVQSGWNALVTTDFGLEVKYDWNMMLYITVPITYSGSLGGLCGNYNGDWTDDQTDIKGTKLSTVLEFAKSWKVADNDSFCQDDCAGKCLLCPDKLKEKYSDESYCGLIAKTNGPFASCHKVVDPGAFFDNCVYDVCINKGVKSSLCENMRSYADACMSAGVKIDANWRMLADCPLPCPENSHYEACGTACAASCSDKDAPSKCNMPCVDGCQCKTGFVLSGTKCVPVNQCGCTYEGRYYLPAKTFWGDKTCTQKCTCNSQTGQVTCVTSKCKSSEVCDLRNGLRQCYPRSYGHCHGSGDPHYLTFDGRAFDFQGTCTYYLSKVVDKSDSSLVPFEVLVKNENRGRNTAVAFTKTVEINVFNYTIIMTKDYYGKVMVNNLFVNLPFEKDSRLSVFLSGYFGVVKTNFGMNVRYNWDSYVSITLPSTYSNVMGGLCGNWNGDINDDLAFPNKSITTNPSVFADSWKARNDNGCTGGCQGNTCPKCDAAERNKEAYTKPCSMITDKNGPFKDCHGKISPTQFYENCVYDMCMYGGHSTALCNALAAYTATCQTSQAIVGSWKTKSFCPASCKANSHYDVCAAGCPQTCSGLTEPAACQRAPCIEGCVCDAGFVLSNGECVSIEQCGCLYEGQYYHLNQVFYPKGKCEFKCTCNDQGQVTCKEGSSCGPNERCEVRDGVQACYPEGQGSCSVSGSGTYRSYDGNSISVAGDCIYKLVEMGQTGDMKKIPFSVMVQQISSAIDVMVTRRVDIVVAQYKIALIPGLLWKIKLNEVTTILPTTLEGGLVKVYQSGLFIVLETTFGLKVTYDTVSTATVEIPSTYKSSVRGLCGNYNDNKADDLLMPDGTQASSVEKFLDAWKVAQEGVNCKTGCLPGSTCTNPDPGAQKEADNSCKILIVENGPFSNCYSKIPPKPFYDDCAKDVPLQPKDKTLVCHHIQKYVALCQQAGISISSWRNNTFCAMNCPAQSHYEICADTCSSSCASLSMAQTCPVCLEGCQCDEGFVFDGGDSPTPPPPDPCANVQCREREQCQNGVCVLIETAICWAVGDPHYKTFDGKFFDLQGTCTYTVSTTIKTEKNLVPFTILVKNNNRGSNYVSYVRTVSVKVYNYTVVASKQVGVVEVDGENTNLPVTLAGGKLKVVQSGWNALIRTDFGLEVKYDWNMMLYITVPITYSGSLGGLCGNYNKDWTDDQTDIKGTKLSTVLEFAKSWKVADNDSFCQDDCAGKCLLCPVELKDKYSDESYCGLIAKTNGPFASCHKVVDPGAFFDNCVYDVCINKGIRSFLCENMRSYADACMSAGVKIDANWRMLADCPLPCPENSHYEACGTACAASCSDKDAPSKCNMPCVEGCQCNTGFVLSGTKCVPVNQCGCTYEGRYYLPAETFWGDKTCTKKCTCNSQTGQVTCVTTKCKSSEVCDVRNGVRNCYPLSYGHCHGSGDPHYLTFDGRAFDFQGTCTYYLSKVVDKSDSSLVPFEVLVKNENRGRNTAVAFTKTVEINIYNYTIIMTKDYYGKIMVNNLFVNLPFEKDSRLSVFLSGIFGVVKTNFGMNVRYNWDSYVSITLPSTYSNVMGGLCGNWNGDINDDLTFPNKSITTNPSEFADSWKARNDTGCTGGCQGNTCPKCDAAERNKEAYTKPCSMITDKNGPFKDCHGKISPTQFYENCVYDMCMYGGHSTALCNALTAYTAACQTSQAIVGSWRTNSFCLASCKANSHYDVCAAGCPQTCSGLTEPAACQRAPCIEGCVCDAGFVLSNGECVSIEQCGCLYEGQYYHLNQVFYPKGKCEFKCTCNDQGQVTCKEGSSCGPNERCEVRDGVQACYPEGQGSCSVSGSGTYRSYDGNSISVAGDCIYKLVEMGQTGDMKKIPFSVMVQQISSAIDVMVTRSVDIVVAQHKITLVPGLLWEIKVDEIKTILPTTLEGGLVKVYQGGLFIVLETTFGLKVTYDTVSTATVEIPSTYKSSVRGLCGNYNDNKADDLLMPDGTQASSVEKFLDAWKVAQEGVNCKTGCLPGSTCTNPDPGAQKEADNSCKILIVENGPFSNCYSKIPPKPFYDDCAKDEVLQLPTRDDHVSSNPQTCAPP